MRHSKFPFSLLFASLILFSCVKEENDSDEMIETIKYTILISADNGGSVNTSGGAYDKGSKVSIIATPNANYEFVSWSDGVTLNPRDLIVNSDIEITAKFTKINPLYLDENGVTIKAKEYAKVGEFWEFKGKEYWIVDNAMLRQYVGNSEMMVTSKVTDMKGLWKNRNLNLDISHWDTSSVKDMSEMFFQNEEFNQDLSDWDVSNVERMDYMFYGAKKFNSSIENWNVGNVVRMDYMFTGALEFNQPVENWDVSSVTNMEAMFRAAYEFNQPLGSWNISKVTTTYMMFNLAYKFNQEIGNWDTSSVESMSAMFYNAYEFNSDLSNWDVSNVNQMVAMFYGCSNFNYDLSSWQTQSVIYCQDFSKGSNLWTLPKPNFTNCNPN